MKKTIALVLAAILLLSLAACGQTAQPAEPAATEVPAEAPAEVESSAEPDNSNVDYSLRVAQMGTSIKAAMVVLANEMGYYAEEGLDVTFEPINNLNDGITAILGGSLDILPFGVIPTCTFVAQGADLTVIGGTIDGKTSVSAKENETLTVVLDQSDIPDGMTFDLWSISSSKLSGDINVDYRAEAMTFQMPAEDVTIRAQYRSAEIIEDAAPSPLATAATIAVGGAAAGIVVWQGVSLGVDLYLANALPQGVPVPTDRRALALLLWETAGKPEVALPTLYGDIPTEEIELQKATRWAVQNGLMDAADKKDASFFDPDHYVTKMDVFGAWLRLKKLLGTT